MKANHILPVVFTVLLALFAFGFHYHYINLQSKKESNSDIDNTGNVELKRLLQYGKRLKKYALKNKYNTSVCFLADMQLPSGKKPIFIYDLQNDTIISSGLIAHGSCNYSFLVNAKFSDRPGCGCSSVGKYEVGQKYNGRFGQAFKLKGLDTSNSNAYNRAVVLHAYDCVPDKETYPQPLCNSLGCAMVSYHFLASLQKQIKAADKPVLLWIFN